MRTTDSIIEDLRKSRDERLAAGEAVDVRAVEQEIIAHQELARLRERRAAAQKAKEYVLAGELDAQIHHWLRFVSEDVDEKVVGDPKKDSVKLVAVDPATEPGIGTRG